MSEQDNNELFVANINLPCSEIKLFVCVKVVRLFQFTFF